MQGLDPQPPMSTPEENRGYGLTFRGIVLPNDAPRPTDKDSWELHYTDDERAHLRFNIQDRVGDPVAFNHEGISHVPWESSRGTGSVRKAWFSKENNMCFEMGVYDTEEGASYAEGIRSGEIAYLSLAHVCVPTQPGEPDLTHGLAPGWKKQIYEVSIVPTEIGPGREGCNIDISNAVSTRQYNVDRSQWTAYCASHGIKKAEVGDAVAKIVITDVPVSPGSTSIVYSSDQGAGESRSESSEPPVSEAEKPSAPELETSGTSEGSTQEGPMYRESEKDALSQEDGQVRDSGHTHSSDSEVTTSNMSDATQDQVPDTNASTDGIDPTGTDDPAYMDTEATSEGASTEAATSETKEETAPTPTPETTGIGNLMKDFIKTLSGEQKDRAMKDMAYAFALKVQADQEEKNQLKNRINEQDQEKAQAAAEAAAKEAQAELETGYEDLRKEASAAISSFGHGDKRAELELKINVSLGVLERVLRDESTSVEKKRKAIASAKEEIAAVAALKEETETQPEDWITTLMNMNVQTGVVGSTALPVRPPVVTVKANKGMVREQHYSTGRGSSSASAGMTLEDFMAQDFPTGSLVDLVSAEARELFGKAPAMLQRSHAIIENLKRTKQFTKVEANAKMTRSAVAMGSYDLTEPGQECDPPSNDNLGIFHYPTVNPTTGKSFMRTVVHSALVPGTKNMFYLARRSMDDKRPHGSKLTSIWNNSPGDRVPGSFDYIMPEITLVADAWQKVNSGQEA